MLEFLADPNVWLAFATLTALEIVLGIDNVVFIAILAGKLPADQRDKARRVGLALALVTRILLLLSLAWVVGLTADLFTVAGFGISGRDLVLMLGGAFLIAKATHEIHGSLEGEHERSAGRTAANFAFIIVQILLLDIVFSLDSVITAVGMVDQIAVMVAAVITAVVIMLFASGPIARFVARHPTMKMLALSFLILIGFMLVAESFGYHVPKGYIYVAMAFSLVVEILNMRLRKASQPIELHMPYERAAEK